MENPRSMWMFRQPMDTVGVRERIFLCRIKVYPRTPSEIETSAKLPLLRGRLHENYFQQAQPRDAPIQTFRAYLKLDGREHRTAMTRLLVSDHMLAVKRLRYEGVPHEDRLCRLCFVEVEDEMYALFGCNGNEELPQLCSVL